MSAPYTKGYLGPSYDAVIMRDGKKLSLDEVVAALNASIALPTGAEPMGDLVQRLLGRAQFLEDRGEVKSPCLLRSAAIALSPIDYGTSKIMWDNIEKARQESEAEIQPAPKAKLNMEVSEDLVKRIDAAMDNATLTARVKALEEENAKLQRLLKLRDRHAATSHKFWIDASKAAFAGDFSKLYNRVDLAEAPPVELVLSGKALSTSDKAGG